MPAGWAVRSLARRHTPPNRAPRSGGCGAPPSWRQASRRLRPAAGAMPAPERPLAVVQIDHTKVDLIVVDEHRREPIGRPYLTIAIDVFSRCIVGMVVTLEAPSATSVGLCLAHMVTEKQPW